MAGNSDLRKAAQVKQDEFYTQLADIENELRHYKAHFKGKTVFCNCDDPFESNFFKYFAMNFNYLGLKKLIATCYVSSPVMYTQLSLFDDMEQTVIDPKKKPYKVEITEVGDENGDGAFDLEDIKQLLKSNKNVCKTLKGDGDFRSEECVQLLKESDIVVTNPPFSLFREYVAQLIEHKKKFIILGNNNAITYKEIFPLLKDNKMWLGALSWSSELFFEVPDNYKELLLKTKKQGSAYIIRNGEILARAACMWYTNLDIEKRHEKLILWKNYNPKDYPTFDELPNVINVNKTAEIPVDYDGLMAVPISFLDKYNPEQFEIIDGLNRYTILDYFGINESVMSRHSHCCNINGKATYYRIVIRRKEQPT